jgi:hypothetical protein
VADQRLSNRRDPADEPVRRIRFILADERVAAFRAVIVVQGHANTEAGLDRLGPGLHQLGAGLTLLPVTQLAIDARECVLVFAALRHVLGDLGPVVLAYECPAHGPSIALRLRRRHRQLSGSKLTTVAALLLGQALA